MVVSCKRSANKIRKHIEKDKIIEITLQLINQNGGSEHVNFREIARQLGCAHTSIYNYFESYPILLSAAMKWQINDMRQHIISELKQVKTKNIVLGYISAIIDYACKNSGLYKFLWIDNIGINIDVLIGGNARPENLFVQEVMTLSGNSLSESAAETLVNVAQTYMHGEIIKFICGRKNYSTTELFKETLLSNILVIIPFLYNKADIRKSE